MKGTENRLSLPLIQRSTAAIVFLLTIATSPARADSMCLIDNCGRQITPPVYSTLAYYGGGLYLARMKGETTYRVLNSLGKEISVKLPPGCAIQEIFNTGADPAAPLNAIPPGALLKVQNGEKFGLIDSSGKTILSTSFNRINASGDHLLSCVNGPLENETEYLFDCKTGKLSTGRGGSPDYGWPAEGLVSFHDKRQGSFQSSSLIGYCDYKNKVVIKPQFEEAHEFHEGFARVLLPHSEHATDFVYINNEGKCPDKNVIAVSDFSNGRAIASTIAAKGKLGVIDKSFHFIIEPRFEQIVFLDTDLFACRKAADQAFEAIDEKDKKLFDFPANVTGFSSYKRGNIPDRRFIIADCHDQLPHPEGLLENTAIFDRAGKQVTPPGFHTYQNGDLIVMSETTTMEERKQGLLSTSGKWVVPLEDSYFQPTEKNCIIKTIRTVHFSPEDWKWSFSINGPYKSVSSERNLAYLLKDYDLIGMSETEVHRLLGNGRLENGIEEYSLMDTIGCGNMGRWLSLNYENGRVKRWNVFKASEFQEPRHWLTQNMVLDPSQTYFNLHLIPKYPGNPK